MFAWDEVNDCRIPVRKGKNTEKLEKIHRFAVRVTSINVLDDETPVQPRCNLRALNH